MSKKKILITGSTGFIGQRFLERVLAKDFDVVCMVRKTSNTEYLQKRSVALVYADLNDEGQVESAILKENPDIVVHAAASVMEKSEEALFASNAAGTRNICQASYKGGVGRLIYVSTIAVLGGNSEMPLTDSMPYKAKNAYGRSKAEAEKIAISYRSKGLAVAIIRPCMIYGENEPHAMDKMMNAVLKRRLPLVDAPEIDSKLQLGYVGNVALAMELALSQEEALKGTFIIADKQPITIKKFVEIAYDELGSGKPPVVPKWLVKLSLLFPPFKSYFKRMLRDRTYDISRAVDLLGYNPPSSTEELLRKTIRYWKQKNSLENTDSAWRGLTLD